MSIEHQTPILSAFQDAAAPPEKQPVKQPPECKMKPFSVRFTREERAFLDKKAGKQPLGAYIRDQLLDGHAVQTKRRSYRKPQISDSQYATLLAMLGQTHLSSNLNQLARHANCGTLMVNDDVEAQLMNACAAVIAMRNALDAALGNHNCDSRKTNAKRKDRS